MHIFFTIWQMMFELGHTIELSPSSNIICQTIFVKTLFIFIFCMKYGTRYQQFLWFENALVLNYFQEHYVETSSDEWCDLDLVLKILRKITTGYTVYCDSDWNLCWPSGKSQGIFFTQSRGNPVVSSNFRRCVACEVSCKISKFGFLAIF